MVGWRGGGHRYVWPATWRSADSDHIIQYSQLSSHCHNDGSNWFGRRNFPAVSVLCILYSVCFELYVHEFCSSCIGVEVGGGGRVRKVAPHPPPAVHKVTLLTAGEGSEAPAVCKVTLRTARWGWGAMARKVTLRTAGAPQPHPWSPFHRKI